VRRVRGQRSIRGEKRRCEYMEGRGVRGEKSKMCEE